MRSGLHYEQSLARSLHAKMPQRTQRLQPCHVMRLASFQMHQLMIDHGGLRDDQVAVNHGLGQNLCHQSATNLPTCTNHGQLSSQELVVVGLRQVEWRRPRNSGASKYASGSNGVGPQQLAPPGEKGCEVPSHCCGACTTPFTQGHCECPYRSGGIITKEPKTSCLYICT